MRTFIFSCTCRDGFTYTSSDSFESRKSFEDWKARVNADSYSAFTVGTLHSVVVI